MSFNSNGMSCALFGSNIFFNMFMWCMCFMMCLYIYVYIPKDHYITDLGKHLCRRPLDIYETVVYILDLLYVQ